MGKGAYSINIVLRKLFKNFTIFLRPIKRSSFSAVITPQSTIKVKTSNLTL